MRFVVEELELLLFFFFFFFFWLVEETWRPFAPVCLSAASAKSIACLVLLPPRLIVLRLPLVLRLLRLVLVLLRFACSVPEALAVEGVTIDTDGWLVKRSHGCTSITVVAVGVSSCGCCCWSRWGYTGGWYTGTFWNCRIRPGVEMPAICDHCVF